MCLCVYICKYVCMYVLVYWYTYILQCLYALTITHTITVFVYIFIYTNVDVEYIAIVVHCIYFGRFKGTVAYKKNYTDDLGVKKIDSVIDILNSYVHSASFSPMTSVPGHFRWKFTDSEATLSPRGRRNCRSPPVGQVHFCGWNLPQSWQPLAAQHYDPLVRHSGCNEQLYRRAIAISAPGHYQLKRRQ